MRDVCFIFHGCAIRFEAVQSTAAAPPPSPAGAYPLVPPALGLWRHRVFSCLGLRFSSFGLLGETVTRAVPSVTVSAGIPEEFCLLLLSSPLKTQGDSLQHPLLQTRSLLPHEHLEPSMSPATTPQFNTFGYSGLYLEGRGQEVCTLF